MTATLAENGYSQRRFPPVPQSAGAARSFIVDMLARAGTEEHVDAAALAVSEVVTNAVLHAGTDVEVQVRVVGAAARVEVVDGSPVRPVDLGYTASASTGRGLTILDTITSRWGTRAAPAGKAVWFEVGEFPERAPAAAAAPTPTAVIKFLRLPPHLALVTIARGDALVREAALLALAEALPPGARRVWKPPRLDLSPLIRAAQAGVAADANQVDVDLPVLAGASEAAIGRLALITEAEELAHKGLLLTLPAVPEMAACRQWMLGQIALQLRGLRPRPWQLPEPEPSRPGSVTPLPSLDAPPGSMAVDGANNIIYADDNVSEMLGWEPGALVGQRLTVIVPPLLRQAHLAGFVRYQLTGEPGKILGRKVIVQALRRDRTTIPVALYVHPVDSETGPVLAATLEPAAGAGQP